MRIENSMDFKGNLEYRWRVWKESVKIFIC